MSIKAFATAFVRVSLLVLLLSVASPPTSLQAQQKPGVCVHSANVPLITTGKWEQRVAMPIFRSEISAAVLDGKIYVAGGIGGKSSFSSAISTSLEAYNPALDSWQELAPLPRVQCGVVGF